MEQNSNITHEINLSIFRFFNKVFGKTEFDGLIQFAAEVGNHNSLPYYLIFAFIIASFKIYKNKHDEAITKELIASWSACGLTLFASLIIGYVLVQLIKNHTLVNRPYCSLEDVYSIASVTLELACNMSFPSGHVSFVTIMLASFWGLFNKFFKYVAAILLIIVAISRMAVGAHYPIDLLGALIINLPLTIYIHNQVEKLLQRPKANEMIHALYSKMIRLFKS